MLPRIQTSDVIRRATTAFQQHNDNCPEVKHLRKTASGQVEITRRKGLIPEAVTVTFHTLLSNYIFNYNAMKQMLSNKPEQPAAGSPPALWTNSVSIAKIARCTDRTVRNHLRLLKKLNMVRTTFHGRRKSFELWISEEILFGSPLAELAAKTPEAPFQDFKRKIFPPILYPEGTLETEGREKRDADIFHPHGDHVDNQGHEGRTEATLLSTPPDGREGTGSAAPAGVAEPSKVAETAQNEPSRAENIVQLDSESAKESAPAIPKYPSGKNLEYRFAYMLAEFWTHAMKRIYPARSFSKDEQEKALSAIMAGVYCNFTYQYSESSWTKFHCDQMTKLDKAARYLEKHIESWAPFPYSIYHPGKGYFDRENQQGFVGLDRWIREDEKRRTRQNREYMLRKAKRDFEDLNAEKKMRADVAGMNLIALFNHYNKIFASYGGNWQQRFCIQYDTWKNAKFLAASQAIKQDARSKPRA